MRKVIKWIKNHWVVASIIFVFLVVAGWIFAELMGWSDIIDSKGATSEGDLLRNLILCIGAIGGVYGLHLATERQKTFSYQGFNDRLGRGVESLANDNVVIRSAGIRVLIDVFDSANETQRSIVANIIYDFFCDKAAIKFDEDRHHIPIPDTESRLDVQNALDFLVNLSLGEREKLLQSRLTRGRLDFNVIDFSYLSFTNKVLEKINFSESHFTETKFKSEKIINSGFYNSTFELSDFGMDYGEYMILADSSTHDLPEKNVINNCDFSRVNIISTHFCNMSIENTEFSASNIGYNEVNFFGVEFIGGVFYCIHDIRISSNSDLPYFVGTRFASANFTFDNRLKPDYFFKSCYYNVDQLPLADSKNIGTSKGTKIIDGMLVFVKSGQPAGEQVAVEIVEWKIAQAKKTGADTTELESELAVAKKELRDAQKRLKESENKLKPKTKKPNPTNHRNRAP